MFLRGADVGHWVRMWFGVDTGWERLPADPRRAFRNDAILAVGLVAASLIATEVMRSIGAFERGSPPAWVLFIVGAGAALPLAWRRRFPLAVLVALYVHWVVVTFAIPMLSAVIVQQAIYFVALFTAVAWARDRRAMLVVVGGTVLVMLGLVVWLLAVGMGTSNILDILDLEQARPGLIDPLVAYWALHAISNFVYFGSAIAVGQLRWHAARREEQLTEQAATIERQASELRDQAVVAERLRIARELHDVVAHHVSVIGIQAAAARRVLNRDRNGDRSHDGKPPIAVETLATIERESREAVGQMRNLLGALRETTPKDSGDERAPGPDLTDLAALVTGWDGLDVTYSVVEEPPGTAKSVPGPVGLSLYRTAQEALANVRRHSTAQTAGVTLRVVRTPRDRFEHGFAEVEVVDDGRPRHNTSGTGLGLLGIRERVAAHHGTVEIGPRVTGGFRVRVRLPLPLSAGDGQ